MEVATFGKKLFAFVGSEKGSFVAVYDITNDRQPVFVQLLPTGMEPEGLLAIPRRNLFLTSDEESGTITVFEGGTSQAASSDQVMLHASGFYWSAISGLAADANRNDILYSVADTLHARIAVYDLENETWSFYLYPLERTSVEGDWIGLSEIVRVGDDRYAVVERDKQIGGAIHLKAVYTFSLEGAEPFEGLVAEDSDIAKSVVAKAMAADLRQAFLPFEKIEGMTVTPDGTVWTALDNDGGEVHSVVYKAGSVSELLK